MRDELKRNFLGFLLLVVGVCLVELGTRGAIPKLADSGFVFIGMAALALQVIHREAAGPKDQAEPVAAL
jgi:hypothetical protein